MTIPAPVSNRASEKGFTLVELLLTVAMILMLAGAVIYNFGVLDKAARLDETAGAVESLLRYARAQASSRGREVRVVFGDASNPAAPVGSTNSAAATRGVQVLWEPDPLGSPGQFKPLPGADNLIDQINDIARVREVRAPSTGSPSSPSRSEGAAPQETASGEAGVAQPPLPVAFYPDGSSDSVEIVLGSATESDNHGLLVTLSGVTGGLSHRLVSMDEAGVERPSESDSAQRP